jgi:hypothetical protein
VSDPLGLSDGDDATAAAWIETDEPGTTSVPGFGLCFTTVASAGPGSLDEGLSPTSLSAISAAATVRPVKSGTATVAAATPVPTVKVTVEPARTWVPAGGLSDTTEPEASGLVDPARAVLRPAAASRSVASPEDSPTTLGTTDLCLDGPPGTRVITTSGSPPVGVAMGCAVCPGCAVCADCDAATVGRTLAVTAGAAEDDDEFSTRAQTTQAATRTATTPASAARGAWRMRNDSFSAWRMSGPGPSAEFVIYSPPAEKMLSVVDSE